jgi:di/tricarboxylate transporter
VIARALEETRAIEMLLLPVLGSPTTTRMAVLRLCLPVAFASAFLNNTPIVAMLISVCEGWAARNGLSIRSLLMPLSFAAMLGGMCTLIGTSTNLVLNSQIENDPQAPLEPFTMFAMSPAGVPAALMGVFYLALAVPVMLRPRATDPDVDTPTQVVIAKPTADGNGGVVLKDLVPPDLGKANPVAESPSETVPTSTPVVLRGLACYCIEVVIDPDCLFVGQHPSVLDATLAKKGRPRVTEVVGLKRGTLEYLPGHESGLRTDVESNDSWSGLLTQPGDSLLVSCLGDAVPRLRAMRGVTALPDVNDASLKRAIPPGIESARHHRRRNPRSWRLVEAVISASSPLSGLSLAEAIALPELEQIIFWGIRNTHAYRNAQPTVRNGEVVGSLAHGDSRAQLLHEDSHDSRSGEPRIRLRTENSASTADAASGMVLLHPGCTLLLEAPAAWVEIHRTSRSFALLGVVGGAPAPSVVSAGCLPPRSMARLRLTVSVLALVMLLSLSATGVVPLLPLSLAIAYVLIALGCITIDQAWRSISFRILLTIACSFGISSALTNTHVAAALATALVTLSPVGPFPFLLLIFLFTSLISCVVSNAATVVLLYTVLRTVEMEGLRPAQMMLSMMIGASSAFATPIGYQTNLMVFARGGYRFGDFTLLGGGLTMTVGLTASLVIWALPASLL